jgi:hypothetical protein
VNRWHGRSRRTRLALLGSITVVLATVAAGCGSSAAKPYLHSKILTFDKTTETVHLDLVAAQTGGSNGFNFDGYGRGQMRVSVPMGWRVDVTCTNASTAFTHSCAVVAGDVGRIVSPTGGTVAFHGAAIANAVSGCGYGITETLSFVASAVGIYRLACLVVGHEADGMWDWFVVTPGGSPSLATSSHPLLPQS